MQNIRLEYDEIEALLVAELAKVQSEAKGLNGALKWTKILKQRISCLGTQKGFTVCTSGFKDTHEPEWLYDMVWYKELVVGDQRKLSEVSLVMECEWNLHINHIKYDFEKLLLANASHRLMVCYAHSSQLNNLIQYFEDAINTYQQGRSGDRFLIAILDYNTDEFQLSFHIKK